MTKAFVDKLIGNMRAAGMVSKTSPWVFEGIGERKMNVRYTGLKIKNEWLDIFSEKNNLLLKFVYDRATSFIEVYLANTTPFIKISTLRFSESDKWEPLFGELKRKLKKDKAECINHSEQVDNMYARLKPFLK